MNTLFAPAIISLALAGPVSAELIPLPSGPCTLMIDTELGGQPQQLWCGSTQYLYHRAGGGISESGWVTTNFKFPGDDYPTISCSGDFFDRPLHADWVRTGPGYVGTGCTPRNWCGADAPQEVFQVNLRQEWHTTAIDGGWLMQIVVRNAGDNTVTFDSKAGVWGLGIQAHVLLDALDVDAAWYLDSAIQWHEFPDVGSLSGPGWLDIPGSWVYPSGSGIGVSSNGVGIAIITPGNNRMPIKIMRNPAGDGSVPDLAFLGSSLPLTRLEPGEEVSMTAYVLVGSLADIAMSTTGLFGDLLWLR